MHELRLPWLELCILAPALGAIWVRLTRDPHLARRRCLAVSGLALGLVMGAWLDFGTQPSSEVRDVWDPVARLLHRDLFVLDELSSPLLPLAALICFLTNLATLRTKLREFSFSRSLASESILLATLACRTPWALVALLALGTAPPLLELRRGGKPWRVYAIHMGLFVALLVAGQALVSGSEAGSAASAAGLAALTLAALVRSGVAPLHCWMTELFEHATFGTALLFVTPMVGVYALVRLVLPGAPPWLLQGVALASLATAVYAAGMALVQMSTRRFFTYLFLSHSSLVLVGIETATPVGLTGALGLWLSVGLALTGFGLTLRCVEARTGTLSLAEFHGIYHHVPMLAGLFLITGLAGVGFPGTAGFVALELLVEGTVRASPLVGAAVVVVAALNGLAVVHAYFRIFTGKRHDSSVDLQVRRSERISVLVLAALIFGGGLYPQPGLESRYRAAIGLRTPRAQEHAAGDRPEVPGHR